MYPRTRKAKRASYHEAVEWIALNDEAEDMDAESIASFVTTCLVADLWDKDTAVVAADILKFKNSKAYKDAVG